MANGVTDEGTMGYNIESAFGDELDADECADIAREDLRRWK